MFVLLLLLGLVTLGGLAVVAQLTLPPRARPVRLRARVTRLLLGAVGYPAAFAVLWYVLRGGDLGAGGIVLGALLGVLFGALVDRLWVLGVSPLAAGIALLIGYLGDPSCLHTCGEDDTWPLIALMTAIYLVAPAIFTLLLGILARNLIARYGPAGHGILKRQPT